jgi:RNA polymerase sigma-70 factor (ECF subfamily)
VGFTAEIGCASRFCWSGCGGHRRRAAVAWRRGLGPALARGRLGLAMASSHEAVETVSHDDRLLVRAARGGDLGAFETLVHRHERRIYGLARRLTDSEHDAQDVTQQTFLSAVKNLAGFRGTAAFSTWLTTIAVHAALKLARKRRGLPTTSLDGAAEAGDDGRVPHPIHIADWRETPDELAHRAETRQLLDAAIAELDPAHRAVFLLRDVEGFSVRDAARALGIGEGNVKVRLLRARLQLRERLTRVLGDDAHLLGTGSHAAGPAVASRRRRETGEISGMPGPGPGRSRPGRAGPGVGPVPGFAGTEG